MHISDELNRDKGYMIDNEDELDKISADLVEQFFKILSSNQDKYIKLDTKAFMYLITRTVIGFAASTIAGMLLIHDSEEDKKDEYIRRLGDLLVEETCNYVHKTKKASLLPN